jgi:exopolyphosphatase / guanosine-5'-triphosphate,3'-diphosphate pyrophosphatase
MMFAAVDLGSNSFRLHISDFENGELQIVKSARDPVRLGAGLDKEGNLTLAAQKIAIESLLRFRKLLSAYKLDAVRVVATNTLRIAKNSAAFLPEAERAIGYPIEIISGEEEGRLIYMGVSHALNAPDARCLVVDIGGGSTELILGQGPQIERVESFSIGTARQVQAFFSGGHVGIGSFNAALLSSRAQFEDGVGAFHPRHWAAAYGSSGTTRVIADAIARNTIGDGTMSYASMEALRDYLFGIGDMSRVRLDGVKAERVPAMVGGLAILMGIMQEVGFDRMSAVDAGLRMGVLVDLQLRATHQDRRESAAWDLLKRFRVNEQRAVRVADIAQAFYAQLEPADGPYASDLRWSALLHEIGLLVSHTDYHKHGAYIVEHGDIAGFTEQEQQLIGKLVLAQKGNLRKVQKNLADPNFAKAALALRLAILFMHSREEVELSRLRLKMKNRIELEASTKNLVQHPTIQCWLEKEIAFWDEVGVPFSVRVQ